MCACIQILQLFKCTFFHFSFSSFFFTFFSFIFLALIGVCSLIICFACKVTDTNSHHNEKMTKKLHIHALLLVLISISGKKDVNEKRMRLIYCCHYSYLALIQNVAPAAFRDSASFFYQPHFHVANVSWYSLYEFNSPHIADELEKLYSQLHLLKLKIHFVHNFNSNTISSLMSFFLTFVVYLRHNWWMYATKAVSNGFSVVSL